MSHCGDSFPLMIILITASLSSNTCTTQLLHAKIGTFEGTHYSNIEHSSNIAGTRDSYHLQTTGFSVLSWFVSRVVHGLKQSDPINRERVYPSSLSPVSSEIISDSVELCETEVCFLHIQLIGTNV